MDLAVGFFDGVHLGHRQILARADAALTFSNHPAAVCAPNRVPRLLMTREERLAAIDAVLRPGSTPFRVRAVPFTPAFAVQPPAAFADWLRAEYPRLGTVFCGPNWTFGAGGAGNAATLRAFGFAVEVVPFALFEGRPVSSTRIRDALATGNLAAAQTMLGRPFALAGTIRTGKGLGRTLGFPTLNVVPELENPPLAQGVYVVSTPWGRGLANWGVAPTLGPRAWTHAVLEVHLTDAPADFRVPADRVRVSFVSYLRPERRFASVAELQMQIARDLAAVRGDASDRVGESNHLKKGV